MSYSNTIDQRMFDFHSYYDMIANELPDSCRVVEIGVASGASALYLAERIHALGKKFTLYMVDGLQYGGVEQLADIIRNVQLSGLGDNIVIMPFDSLNASLKFNDNSLDFALIDASHTFEGTKADIRLWQHKIKHGAILSGHDYNEHEGIGVKQAVDELIPTTIQRPTQGEDKYEPEPFLEILNTYKELGIWQFKKVDYFTIK